MAVIKDKEVIDCPGCGEKLKSKTYQREQVRVQLVGGTGVLPEGTELKTGDTLKLFIQLNSDALIELPDSYEITNDAKDGDAILGVIKMQFNDSKKASSVIVEE